MNKELLSINNTISESIRRSDEKATSLFAATGIVFGLSSIFVNPSGGEVEKRLMVLFYIVLGLYLTTFLFLMIIFSMTIFPRRKPKKDRDKNIPCKYYYNDVYSQANKDSFENFLNEKCSDETLINQIQINSRIAHTKENLLILTVIGTIVFSILLVTLIVLALF